MSYSHSLDLSDYFKLPAGTRGAAPFPVSGADNDEISDFEARRRKLGYIWINSTNSSNSYLNGWVTSSSDDQKQIAMIQPIPSSLQLFMGDGEDDDDYFG